MSKKPTSIIISTCLLFFLPFNVYPSSIKEDYELSERCGKRSGELFKEKYGEENVKVKTENGFVTYGYSNHYNKKLNKCFQIIETTYCKDDSLVKSKFTELLDINDKRTYGELWESFDPYKVTNCYGPKNNCQSKQGWALLVKPYMEE